jgi:ribosomal protein L18
MYLPDGDKYSTQRKEALANLIVTMGGRIAEAFHSDDVSNGASGDIRQATSLARAMVCEWGMSDKLGMVEYGDGDSPVFIGRGDMGGRRVNYSGHTAQVIDDVSGATLASVNTTEDSFRKDASSRANVATALKVGKLIAERGLAKNIAKVVFDRGGFMYHGKIKALADAARDGGLQF